MCICLLLTRPVTGQIIIMNKGMWLFGIGRPDITPRAAILREFYLRVAKEGSVIRVPCCDCCETTGHHRTILCTKPDRKDGLAESCDKCGSDKHTVEACPGCAFYYLYRTRHERVQRSELS
jgi:hypothetical protein